MSALSRRRFLHGAATLFVGAAGLGLFGGCSPPVSQQPQPAKVYRLGWLASSEPGSANAQAFLQEMRERGCIEGQNLAIEWRLTDGQTERLAELAAELVRLPVDVIVTASPPPSEAARDATSTIPIVFIGGSDPVGRGFVASFARPGGNLTGLTTGPITVITEKQLELLKESVPSASRVAVLWHQPHAAQRQGFESAALALGVQWLPLDVRSLNELEGAFEVAVREQVDALLVWPDPLFAARRAPQVADLAARHRLPTMFTFRSHVEAGGLMSYGPSLTAQWRRAAFYVDKILQGTKPAELPVEQPQEIEFVINLPTARALGLTIPEHVLVRAKEVIP